MDPEEWTDRLFFALSDRTRRRILKTLILGELSTQELSRPLQMSKQLVSKHLLVLERAGLITSEREGRTRNCRINPYGMKRLNSLMDHFRGHFEDQFDVLDAYTEMLHS